MLKGRLPTVRFISLEFTWVIIIIVVSFHRTINKVSM